MSENSKYEYTPLPEPIPISDQVWPEGTSPLVHTRTMTFNHENFIRDCIDGILMQKTTFPVQVLIHDDASTDRTAEIVKEYETKYPHLIKSFYQKENSYSKSDKHKRREEFMSWRIGKYEAICEGDDYWIDPYKLQRQVDYLDVHSDCGCIFTDYNIVNTNSEIIDDKHIPILYQEMKKNVTDGRIFAKLFNHPSCILTCTIMYRWEFFNSKYIIDHDRIFDIASKMNVKYDPMKSACYRINPDGMMRSQQKLVRNSLFVSISKWMINYYSNSLANELYDSKTLREVRLFFSKYFTEYIKRNRNTSLKILMFCLQKDLRLLYITPYFILHRIYNNLK